MDQVIALLQVGLAAEVVDALLRIRFGSQRAWDQGRVAMEQAYCESVRRDVAGLLARRVVSAAAAAAIDSEFEARLAAIAKVPEPARRRSPAYVPPPTIESPAAGHQAPQPAAPLPTPLAPSAPPVSLRDLFAEHSVVILASLGAFLLVVATVLFELYGTVGLGGEVRLGAVIALNLVFAAAGYLAHRQERLRAVGSIYIGLAAVLLPLVGLAAWTFLHLGERGITVDQGLAITGGACAVTYGFLGRSLGLRLYGEMAGVAVLVASWGISGAVAGEQWRSVGLALTPLVYAAVTRSLPDRVFSNFPWYAHAAALISLLWAANFDRHGWVPTATLLAIAGAYLTWNAVAPDRSRAWLGELAVILTATVAAGPLGLRSYHFALPMLAGIPLLLLVRRAGSLGAVGRLYRAHPGHIHAAVLAGVSLALAENIRGETWALAAALWIATGLYAADFWLGRTDTAGIAVRAALPAALIATGQAAGLGAWQPALVSLALIAYVVPFTSGAALKPLTRYATPFFYAVLAVVAIELLFGSIGAGRWEIPMALAISAIAFAAASEVGGVRFSAYAARALFTGAWFAGVDALDAGGWRGPFDALLALVYVAAGQARSLARHSVATAGRRWFVHLAALVAFILCFTGPDELLWWRLAAASASLASAYWWLAVGRTESELPWLAWASTVSAAGSLAMAWAPEAWQGTAMVAAAVALTGAWAVARIYLSRPQLEQTALPVLSALAAAGLVLTLREEAPQWSQAIAGLLAGGFLLTWARLRSAAAELVQILRAVAAAVAAAGLLVGAAVLKADAGQAGLLAVAIAAGHAEWTVRAKGDIERWYAVGALLLMAPVIYFWYLWPYSPGTPSSLLAVEFTALAVVCVQAAARRNQWFLLYPATLLVAAALHFILVALGFDEGERERVAFAALAGVIGFVGLVLRATYGRRWALSTEAGAATIAFGALLALASHAEAGPGAIALLGYAALIYSAAMQERQPLALPVAVGSALLGICVLLYERSADTILYAAALGLLGLAVWLAGWAALAWLGRHPVVDMHRYLGLGLLVVASLAGFAFPGRTGPSSLGAVLAAVALLVTGAVLWLDARTFGFRPNMYLALVCASAAGYFVMRDVRLESWELIPPGLGVIACGIRLRSERGFNVDHWARQLIVATGLGFVMGWAAVFTVTGDLFWLVALLVEGALAVGAGIVLRSRILLAGGGMAVALVSLRALLTVAQAGYLFAAFGVVALVLLALATGLALSRERALAGARGMREQLAQWD
jgi:hypothetical protein